MPNRALQHLVCVRGYTVLVMMTVWLTPTPAQALGDELFKLTAVNDPQSGQFLFGRSVAVSGTTAIIGAPLDAFTFPGAAYLFDTTTGEQLFKLLPSNSDTLPLPANFGISVDISGDRAIVGARRSASGLGNSWAYLFDVSDPDNPIETHILSHDGMFGQSVAISGDRAIVGARLDDDDGLNSGSAYLYDVETGSQLFKLTASDAAAADEFGTGVAISGTSALVGARNDDDAGDNSGSAYLFDVTNGEELAKLTASDAATGDNFGVSMALSGSIAAVGSPLDDDGASNAGAVYLFDLSDPLNPIELRKLVAQDPDVEERFGLSVAINGNTVVVGTPTSGFGKGAAYLFDLTTGTQLVKLLASDGALGDTFGSSVAMSGTRAVVGSPGDGDNGSNIPGSVYVFDPFPEPGIDVVKDGDPLSKVGDPVTYTFDVTNTGGIPLSLVSATDTLLGALTAQATAAGCGTLAIGASCHFEAQRVVQAGDPDPLPSTVSVEYDPTMGTFDNVSDSDDHEVNLFQPSVNLVKTGPDFSKVGDIAPYAVKITNTSSDDSPALELASFSDSLVPSATPPADCLTLAPGAMCQFSYDYTVQAGDDSGEPGATLSNTASVLYHPLGFPNDITEESTWELTLLHPDYELTKTCADEPVPQEGPAIFDIVFENTGDVALELVADEDISCDGTVVPAGGELTIVIGETKSCTHEADGPFTGIESVENTISATATLPDELELPNELNLVAQAECGVGGRMEVEKTTSGGVDPSLDLVFAIYDGPNEGGPSGFLATPLVTDSTLADGDGVLTFELSGLPVNLDPLATYTLCELDLPSGWTAEWMVDTDGDHVPDTVNTPYDPNAGDVPPVDLGNRCVDFGAGEPWPVPAGDRLDFAVNNVPPPGGDARAPGYWKNWNRCTGGGQADVADANGGPAEGFFLLEDVLPIVWDDILVDGFLFQIDSCAIGVDLLDRRDIGDPEVVKDGEKRANDAAYYLASHLLAAQANFAAGAAACADALDAAADGEELLDSIDFDGTGSFLSPQGNNPLRDQAIVLAATLDLYNNNGLCGP